MPIKGHLEDFQHSDDRSFARRELRLETSGAVPGGSAANVTVHNISQSGMLIETDLVLGPRDEIMINLPEAGEVTAHVVWSSGDLFGCRFSKEIAAGAVSAAQLRGEARTPFSLGGHSRAGALAGGAFGKRIEQLRKAKGMTLSDVAERLGVSKPTVWAWEKGKARPIDDRFPALARALGVEKDELLGLAAPQEGQEALDQARALLSDALGIAPERLRILIEIA